MKKYIILLTIVIFTFSCKKDEINNKEREIDSYYFFPRKVSYVGISVLKSTIKYDYLGNPYTDYEVLDENAVHQDQWRLSVGALNFNPYTIPTMTDSIYRSLVDTPILEVERLLKNDYERTHAKQTSKSSSSSGDYLYLKEIDIEYRTSVVRNFSVYSLNADIFGKSAGESLNEFFDIVRYDPAIISTPNYRLIEGYENQKSIAIPIDEWLSVHPLALAGMSIAPNHPITELPLDVQFVVEMETDEGLVLRDTTRMFTIME